MNKVYMVLIYHNEDNFNITKTFSSEELAKKFVQERLIPNLSWGRDVYKIMEVTVENNV